MLIFRRWMAAAACVGLFADPARPQTASEFQVKSAYLFDFAKRAQWPERALPNDKSKLVICVFGGESDFPDVLKSTLAGKDIREHRSKSDICNRRVNSSPAMSHSSGLRTAMLARHWHSWRTPMCYRSAKTRSSCLKAA